MNTPGAPGAANDSALSDYFDELLDSTSSAPEPQESVPDPDPEAAGIQVAAGRIAADDERHYLFQLAGLTLALPAARISAEYQPALSCTSAGQRQYLAQLPQGGSCRMLDLAQLLLSGNHILQEHAAAVAPAASIVLDQQTWGFHVSLPGELKMLDLDQVQWRGPHSQRPWLAGTWAARRLVLLDLDGLAGLLA